MKLRITQLPNRHKKQRLRIFSKLKKFYRNTRVMKMNLKKLFQLQSSPWGHAVLSFWEHYWYSKFAGINAAGSFLDSAIFNTCSFHHTVLCGGIFYLLHDLTNPRGVPSLSLQKSQKRLIYMRIWIVKCIFVSYHC